MRVLTVDDESSVQEILSIFFKLLGHEIVGQPNRGTQAIEMIDRLKPELIVLDLRLPDMFGLEILEKCDPQTLKNSRVLVYSAYCNDYTTYLVEKSVIHGFVYKPEALLPILPTIVDRLKNNRTYFCDAFIRQKSRRKSDPYSFDKVLTDRQFDVAKLVGHYLSDRQIAERLHIAPATVEKHRLQAGIKLNVHGHESLVKYVREHGLTIKDLSFESEQ